MQIHVCTCAFACRNSKLGHTSARESTRFAARESTRRSAHQRGDGRLQAQELLLSLVLVLVEQAAAVTLHPRVLEVVALLRGVGAEQAAQVRLAPHGVVVRGHRLRGFTCRNECSRVSLQSCDGLEYAWEAWPVVMQVDV